MLELSINYVYVQNDTAFGIGDAVELMKQPGEARGGIALIQAIWEDKPTHGEVRQQACCRRYYRAEVRNLTPLITLISMINLKNELPTRLGSAMCMKVMQNTEKFQSAWHCLMHVVGLELHPCHTAISKKASWSSPITLKWYWKVRQNFLVVSFTTCTKEIWIACPPY